MASKLDHHPLGTSQSAEADDRRAADCKPAVRWGLVLAIALPLIVLNGGWITYSEMRTTVTEITISTLLSGVLFVLLAIALLNLAAERVIGRERVLRQAEMLAIYSLLSMSTVISGVGHFGFFTPFLTAAFNYASPTNGWKMFWYLLPGQIGPRDPDVLKGFYDGNATFFRPEIMRAWAFPLISWGIFFLVVLWTTLCIAAMLRHRWAEEEHLAFPVLAVPLEITRPGAPILRSPLLWCGFAIPAFFHSLNSLHYIFPTLPLMNFNTWREAVKDYNLQFPLNGMGATGYLIHCAGVGMGYLINTDVTFSLWFFYVLKRIVNIAAVSFALRDPASSLHADGNYQFPCWAFQAWGAWLTVALMSLWAARRSLGSMLRHAMRGDPDETDMQEAMSVRAALAGTVVGIALLCGFVWSWGGAWWLPIVFFSIYFLLMIAIARVRAEAAVLSSELVWVDPQSMIVTAIGSGNLARPDLAHIASLSWFNLDYRTAPMPHQIEALVAQKRTGGTLRGFVPVLMLGCAVAIVSALIWDLQFYYSYGAATGHIESWRVDMGVSVFRTLAHWLNAPRQGDPHVFVGGGFGALFTLALAVLRARFIGFPLCPVGYALNVSFANDFFWCDMFVAWLVKTLVLRYGGMNLFQKLLPFFVGLILGDFVTGCIWSLIGTGMGIVLFRTFSC